MDVPKKLSIDDIAPFLEKIGIPKQKIQESEILNVIKNQWKNIVPEKLAKNCFPVSFKEGVLTIKVKNSIYAQELSWYSGQIMDRLNHLGICVEKIYTKYKNT